MSLLRHLAGVPNLEEMSDIELLEFIESSRSHRTVIMESAFGERQQRRATSVKRKSKVVDPVAERERQERMARMSEVISVDEEF